MKRERTDLIVLCSSDTEPNQDLGLKEIDNRDRRRGYFRCVHHFVIKRCGTIEHGRDYKGPAMGLGFRNAVAVSVCVIGGKGEPPLERAQLESLRDLVRELHEQYPDAEVIDHHQLDSKAPALEIAKYVCN